MPTRRKSDLVHWLQHTSPHDRTPATESNAPAGRPPIPKDVSKKVFKSLCRELEKRKALTSGDLQLIRLFCVLYERHSRALEKLAAEGEIRSYPRATSSGEVYQCEAPNLWLKVAENAEARMISCLDRLGLTPLNREKVRPTKPDGTRQVIPGSLADTHPEIFSAAPLKPTPVVFPDPPQVEEV
jgi:P27 family predicted phage terminase small subunit